ncbi:hypothetical protein ACS0TY_027227 [Phlomoides rotata]
MFVPPEVCSEATREREKAHVYFYYGDDRWETFKKIFSKSIVNTSIPTIRVENNVNMGGPNDPIIIEESMSSTSLRSNRRQFSNSIDQESHVSDISSFDDTMKHIRIQRPRPIRGSSNQRSTAGSKPRD